MNKLLEASNLTKNYAGLLAVDDFSLSLHKSEIHALIGPNGAGKSTAIGLLTGEVKSDKGVVKFLNTDITQMQTWQRAKIGLGHTYQITSVINEMRVIENMIIALLANTHSKYVGISNPYDQPELLNAANESLERYDLIQVKHALAGELSHGEQGRLEIAMCIATRPKVLLLDEPMSGMSLLDGETMIGLLGELKQSVAILLVEHDMEAVFKLADRISVMASGKIIASADPQTIRKHPKVIEAYLGQTDA